MTVARATLRELLGRKVLLWGGLLSAAFVGLYAAALAMIRRELSDSELDAVTGTVLVTLALFIVSFLGSFLGLVLSAGSVASEVDGGLIHPVAARPLSRSRWLLERWLAIAGLVAAYAVVMGGTTMALGAVILGYQPLSVPGALLGMAAQTVVMVTIGMALSIRLSAVASGVVLFALYGVAWLGGVIEFIGQAVNNQGMVNAGIVTSLLMPTDGLWRAASYYAASPSLLSDLVGQTGLPFSSVTPPATAFVVWCLGYVAVAGMLALRTFQRRDL